VNSPNILQSRFAAIVAAAFNTAYQALSFGMSTGGLGGTQNLKSSFTHLKKHIAEQKVSSQFAFQR
jgi:hypothetical protein